MWQKSRPIRERISYCKRHQKSLPTRLFSNFDGGKQGKGITKNKAPSVSLLMVNNKEKCKLQLIQN